MYMYIKPHSLYVLGRGGGLDCTVHSSTCTYTGFHLGGGAFTNSCLESCSPLEFVCTYAHYDNPVRRPHKIFQIQVPPFL